MENEKVFDEKGRVIKELTYNAAEPATKLISQKEIDEKGRTTAETDPRGNIQSARFVYEDGKNNISKIIYPDGQKTALGYNYLSGATVNISSTVYCEENANVMGYNLGLLTSLKHYGNQVQPNI